MGINASSARVSPGAGRTVHVFWPDFAQIIGNVANNGSGRGFTSATTALFAQSVTGAPPAQTTQDYKGRRCWGLSSAVGGAGVRVSCSHRVHPMQDAVQYPVGLNDIAVIETRWLLAFDRPAGDLADGLDLGVGLSPGNNDQNMNNAAVGAVYRAGVQFGPGGPGKLRLRSRRLQTGVGPPPYTADFDTGNTARVGFDEREWHWYGLRFVDAQQGLDGVCSAYLDGSLFSSFSMGTAGGLFPASNAGTGGAVGHLLGIVNFSNATFDKMYVARGLVLMAPDEISI